VGYPPPPEDRPHRVPVAHQTVRGQGCRVPVRAP
jgi:hypothetical protein